MANRIDASASFEDQLDILNTRLIGQPHVFSKILPYVQMHQAGLAPEGRPIGVFLLMGPTGTGKTKAVEVLSEALHGTTKSILRIDCGEYQSDHEIAKLIGAPPGYLGHRETQPMLNQHKLNAATSEHSNLSIVLFDEIEKAASSLQRLLLGVFDKATLKLGDNTGVNFERSIIFMTSNLGAKELNKAIRPNLGFEAMIPRSALRTGKLADIGTGAAKRSFSPEFVNRIDAIITYNSLTEDALRAIVDAQLDELRAHINMRFGSSRFQLYVSIKAREFLLRVGTSQEYGARELKRMIVRHITQPLAARLCAREIYAQSRVTVDVAADGESLEFTTETTFSGRTATP